MVTKEDFSALHEEFVAFQAETPQNFRDVREDIADLGRKRNLNLTTFLAVLNMSSKSSVSRAASEKRA